jgi:hypothetical protein
MPKKATEEGFSIDVELHGHRIWQCKESWMHLYTDPAAVIREMIAFKLDLELIEEVAVEV